MTKPLAIVTTYGRLEVTQRMLASLEPSVHALEVVIVDNGNPPAQLEWEKVWARANEATVIAVGMNVGCPRALNLALAAYRQPGQAVIKLDNDILMPEDARWLRGVERLVETFLGSEFPVGLIGACFPEVNTSRVRGKTTWEFQTLYRIFPVIGHAVYHSGALMDQVGFFDVLHSDHLYGFEDNLMSIKATTLGFQCLAWTGWTITDIQRHSALGGRATVDAHIEAMRPLYNMRLQKLRLGGTPYTGPDGLPVGRKQE